MVSGPGGPPQPSYCGRVISPAELSGYALASFVLIVIPGPSVLFVVGRALAYGRRTALATVLGNAAGNYLVAICVAVVLWAPAYVMVSASDALMGDVRRFSDAAFARSCE